VRTCWGMECLRPLLPGRVVDRPVEPTFSALEHQPALFQRRAEDDPVMTTGRRSVRRDGDLPQVSIVGIHGIVLSRLSFNLAAFPPRYESLPLIPLLLTPLLPGIRPPRRAGPHTPGQSPGPAAPLASDPFGPGAGVTVFGLESAGELGHRQRVGQAVVWNLLPRRCPQRDPGETPLGPRNGPPLCLRAAARRPLFPARRGAPPGGGPSAPGTA